MLKEAALPLSYAGHWRQGPEHQAGEMGRFSGAKKVLKDFRTVCGGCAKLRSRGELLTPPKCCQQPWSNNQVARRAPNSSDQELSTISPGLSPRASLLLAHMFLRPCPCGSAGPCRYLLPSRRKMAASDGGFYCSRKRFRAAAGFHLLFPSRHFLKGPICLLLSSTFPFRGLPGRGPEASSGLTPSAPARPQGSPLRQASPALRCLHRWGGHWPPQEDSVLGQAYPAVRGPKTRWHRGHAHMLLDLDSQRGEDLSAEDDMQRETC